MRTRNNETNVYPNKDETQGENSTIKMSQPLRTKHNNNKKVEDVNIYSTKIKVIKPFVYESYGYLNVIH
jgi:hypothetical protein